ncbi:MAG: AcrR family transcriptional regulator [Pseudohongiellaceae bacterium]|jgi:AcrR family transcriptional regulator
MTKGDDTRSAILEAGMDVAATDGLEALSIGRLADRVGMSKSGLFAHFHSKEELQLQVLQFARDHFVAHVMLPAMGCPRGEPRIRALLENWLQWGSSPERVGGCVFLQAAAEYDDRPGLVRDLLVQTQRDWHTALARAAGLAVSEGHFRTGLDEQQFAFEMYALIMAHHFHLRLLEDPSTPNRTRTAFERLLQSCR